MYYVAPETLVHDTVVWTSVFEIEVKPVGAVTLIPASALSGTIP